MSRVISRGALIVFEGCDRSGKTTQCKILVDALNKRGIKAKLWRFPDRETTIGKVINGYLGQSCELENHAIHLLFTANRWEAVPRMMDLLWGGTTLVVDRYSYSGVAFSASKQGMDIEWCKQPEVGLPKPDAVLFLHLPPEEATSRAGYGGERYEKETFQKTVAEKYKLLEEDNWKVINANKTVDELHEAVREIAVDVIAKSKDKEIGRLWVSLDTVDTLSNDLPRKNHYKRDNNENMRLISTKKHCLKDS